MMNSLAALLLFQLVGPQPDGSVLLNTGWRVKPIGTSIAVGTLPMSRAMSPDGRYLLVMNGGYLPPTISVLDILSKSEVQRIGVPSGWRGLAFTKDGRTVYASQGPQLKISRFSFTAGRLAEAGVIDVSSSGQPGESHLLGDLVLTRDGRSLIVADTPQNRLIVVNLEDGSILRIIETLSAPYALLPDSLDANILWVSHWTASSVGAYAIDSGKQVRTVVTGKHPTEMVWLGRRLAVACANTNHVEVYEEKPGGWTQTEVVSVAMTPKQPAGMTPSALSLSPDGKTLLVVCSDANTVGVVDVSGKRLRVAGFLPAGWYPTGAAWLTDGRVAILNGRGSRSHPNPKGKNPLTPPADPAKPSDVQYVLRIQPGSVQFVEAWNAEILDRHTNLVRSLSPWRDELLADAGAPEGNPVPTRPGDPSPIKHVILLMKENRTYDQVLGDLEKGNGDPSLLLFGEEVTPNHHKLAREFTLLDNFYVNADVSADGYYWTTSAIAPDTTQKTFPLGYARRAVRGKAPPSPEGIRTAPGGHIWDAALRAGRTIRNYGFTAVNLPQPPETGVQIADVRDPVLRPHTSYEFRQHDRAFSDMKRMQVVIDDLKRWEEKGEMPHLVLITIGNDHTEGTRPGACTPQSCVADNDQALGMLAEALSKSRFWSNTALFVLEDDAQDGPDHVDSHRSPAYVISAYTRRTHVDSTHYSTVSMLRTIELILGLEPMTHFDASAKPMYGVFQNRPDLTPYTREQARVSMTDLNPERSTTAHRSNAIDLRESDRADDAEFNDILYLAIQGRPAPAPRRTVFGEIR